MASPRIRVLNAAMERLLSADLPTSTGLPDLKFRWARNRYTTREERPCVALAFVSDEPADDGQVAASTDETVRVLAFDIIVDLETETEAQSEASIAAGVAAGDFDPTGLATLSWVLDLCMLALRACMIDPLRDTTALGRMADWVQDVSIDEDEELPDDDGRLVGRANVIYRTNSWDPTVLLERT